MTTRALQLGTLLLLLTSTQLPAELTAEVDRTLITEGEALRYTLRSDKPDTMKEPDFTAIKKKFHIARTEKSRQFEMIQGRYNVWMEWILTLYPRESGTLTIPSVSHNLEISNAVAIKVGKKAPAHSFSTPPPVFMHSTLRNPVIWQGQETILSLEIWTRARFAENPDLTPPETEGIAARLLDSDKREERTIDGIPYRVMLVNYMITPTRTGLMTIPAQQLSGTLADSDPLSPHSLLRMTRTRPFQVESTRHSLHIKEPPAQWPADSPWLPAEHLALSERWSQNPDQLRAGEPVTRTVTVHVRGVHSAQIPPLAFEKMARVKSYKEQAETDDTIDSHGRLKGKRQESVALVASAPGAVTLPAIRVTWFNVGTETVETSSLPARTLHISGAEDTASIAPELASTAATVSSEPFFDKDSIKLSWQAICALLVTGWITTVLLWLWARKRHSHLTAPSTPDNPSANDSTVKTEAQAFKTVLNASSARDLASLEQALLLWGKLITGKEACSATEIVHRLPCAELSTAWQAAQLACYGTPATQKKPATPDLTPLLKKARQQWLRERAGSEKTAMDPLTINPPQDRSRPA